MNPLTDEKNMKTTKTSNNHRLLYIICFLLLSIGFRSVAAEYTNSEYFCDYQGGTTGDVKGLIHLRKLEDTIWVRRNENKPRIFQILEESSTHVLFYRMIEDTDKTPIVDFFFLDTRENYVVWYTLFDRTPEVSYHFEGKCMLRLDS